MHKWLLLLWLVLGAGMAYARMGENQVQHEQRYGRAREDARTNYTATLQLNCKKTYDYQGWRLVVTFVDGQAAGVEYWDSFAHHDAAASILRAEAGDGRWTQSAYDRWTNTNGRIAIKEALRMVVMSQAFAARQEAEKAARRAPRPPPAF